MLHDDAASTGNKRFKLAPHLSAADDTGCHQVLSFGGPYSNHIHALAMAARECGLGSIGIIRGEPAYASNPTLNDAQQSGMRLEFVSRQQYRHRHDPAWHEELKLRYPRTRIIPEGGSDVNAALACAGMLDALGDDFLDSLTLVTCAVGTGATLAGLHHRLGPMQCIYGYQVVQDKQVHSHVSQWISQLSANNPQAAWELLNATSPAYAKLSEEQSIFTDRFFQDTGILLDPIYTAKMMYHVLAEIERGLYTPGSRILAVHTGGLQGWRGMLDKISGHLSLETLATIRELQLTL